MRRLLPALLLLAALPAAAGDLALRAGEFRAPGRSVTDPVILVRDGRIAGVRSGMQAPRGAELREWGEGTVITLGLVDAHTHLGLRGESDEDRVSMTPEVRAADAFQPAAGEREAVLAAGITSLYVSPGDRNLIGGQVAHVKPAPLSEGGWRIVDAEAAMAVSLTDASRVRGRAPTSLHGQVTDVREFVGGGNRRESFVLHVRVLEPEEALAAAELGMPTVVTGRALYPMTVHSNALNRGLPFVIGPLSPGDAYVDLTAGARLHAVGSPLAFGTGWAGPARLRLQALQAVRYFLQPDVALDALMGQALGERRVEGGPADLVVWSGNPLDGSSRVLAVFVDGNLLHEGEE